MSDGTVKLIMFDCDGTLVDSQYGIFAAMCFAFEQCGLEKPGRALVNQQVGLPVQEGIQNLIPEAEEELCRNVAQQFHAAIYEHQIPQTATSALFPNCRETLQALKDRGYFLGIATGMGRRGLERTVVEHEIAEFFTVLKSADDGPGKPDPTILHDAMLEMGAENGDTVMIGDTVYDIHAGVNARIFSIGVDWGYHDVTALRKAGANSIISDFLELPDLLDKHWVE